MSSTCLWVSQLTSYYIRLKYAHLIYNNCLARALFRVLGVHWNFVKYFWPTTIVAQIVLIFGMMFVRFGGNWVCVILFVVIRLKLSFIFFALIFFIFKKLLAPRVLENSVASRVLTYCCTIPRWRAPVGEIWNPPEGVKYVEYPWTYKLWEFAFDVYRWIHTDAIINTPPNSSYLNFSMTLQTDKGDVIITIYLYGNVSGCLVGVDYGWVTRHIYQTCSNMPEGLWVTYHE